jgi:RNA-directed DNA polymerase
MHRNSSPVSTKQQRVAELAKQSPQRGFTSLAYLMDIDWLHEAFRRTRKDGAAGVDGITAADYEANLEANLQTLLNRAKAGTYRAPPVRRVHIPKGGSATETRPIGIPTLEDKVLQRAVAMLLEPIYEQDFYNCSYGFRPGRSAHQALEALWKQTMDSHGGWILEVDIRKFFDTLDHAHLRAFLQQRVRDGVLTRLIGKWLQAGVMAEGTVTFPEAGSPQGGVITPPTILRRLVSWTVSYLVRGSDRATGRNGRQAGSEAAFYFAVLQEVSRHGRFGAAVGAAGGACVCALAFG